MRLSVSKINLFILALIQAYLVVTVSSNLREVYPNFQGNTHVLLLIVFFVGLYELTQFRISPRIILFLAFILLLNIFGVKIMPVFGVGMLAVLLLNMTERDVLTAFFIGNLTGILFTVLLCLIGVISRFGVEEQYITFGFRNPNGLGVYLAVLMMVALVNRFFRSEVVRLISSCCVIIFVAVVLKDYTAAMMVFLTLIGTQKSGIWQRLLKSRFIAAVTMFLPALLVVLSFKMASLYGTSKIVNIINGYTSRRPSIWHYYLANWQLGFWPRSGGFIIPNGGEQLYGGGAFDGAYISFPFSYGTVLSCLFLVILIVYLGKLIRQKKYNLLVFALVVVIASVSENFLTTFYFSPLLMMAVASIGKEN